MARFKVRKSGEKTRGKNEKNVHQERWKWGERKKYLTEKDGK